MSHYWRVKRWLPERYGQHCKIIATGTMNSVMVEFADGMRYVTCRYFIRKLKGNGGNE